MNSFGIGPVQYEYLKTQRNEYARYGLAISYWHTNLEDLMFQLRMVSRWLNREWIEVSVCSHASPGKYLREVCDLSDHVVHCTQDGGHQNGTTMQCNGAICPLDRQGIRTVTHTDADTPILHPAFFFGFANMLFDQGKAILTSTNSFDYQKDAQSRLPHLELGPGSHTDRQFGSMFVLNRMRLLFSSYWPFIPRGNFESDRYTQFIEAGFTVENDAIILPRLEQEGPGLLQNIDFHLGVMHNTNVRSPYEQEDRKDRLLKVLSMEAV